MIYNKNYVLLSPNVRGFKFENPLTEHLDRLGVGREEGANVSKDHSDSSLCFSVLLSVTLCKFFIISYTKRHRGFTEGRRENQFITGLNAKSTFFLPFLLN